MASSDDRKAENKYKNKKNTFDRKNKNKMLKFIEHTTMQLGNTISAIIDKLNFYNYTYYFNTNNTIKLKLVPLASKNVSCELPRIFSRHISIQLAISINGRARIRIASIAAYGKLYLYSRQRSSHLKSYTLYSSKQRT